MIKFCESTYQTKRGKTREVLVGNVGVGGLNPVRIQSMTTSSTRDIEAIIDQIMRLAIVQLKRSNAAQWCFQYRYAS